MKTEDGGIDDLLPSLPPPPPPPSPQSGAKATLYTNGSAESAATGASQAQSQSKRTVCDHCRRRSESKVPRVAFSFLSTDHLGIRCDGQLPCQPCVNASLACKRDHVPLKRGPKRGRGRVINELRERYSIDQSNSNATLNHNNKHSRESSIDL
jgi:hypothetical protein